MLSPFRPLAFIAGVAAVAFSVFGAAPAFAQEPETFDLGIAEVTVTGAVGTVVPVTLTVRSNGPQAADRFRIAVIERPAGTEFAGAIPSGCDSSDMTNRYYCAATGGLAVGASVSFEFGLKIVDAHPGVGALFFADGGGHEDLNPGNDHAALTVTVPTTGEPSVSASPSASAPAAPATPKASPAPGLPVTGDRTALYAGVGAVCVAAGVVLFLIARRKRVRLVTPER